MNFINYGLNLFLWLGVRSSGALKWTQKRNFRLTSCAKRREYYFLSRGHPVVIEKWKTIMNIFHSNNNKIFLTMYNTSLWIPRTMLCCLLHRIICICIFVSGKCHHGMGQLLPGVKVSLYIKVNSCIFQSEQAHFKAI
jgi:hypothetical protein